MTAPEGRFTAAADGADAARAQYLAAMRLAPAAVAIIAAAHEDDRTGMAATAWNSLSADPPTLLACVNRNASVYAMIRRAGAFSVNLLAFDHPETVAVFSARRGLTGRDRFAPEAWDDGPLRQPLLNTAIASFECRLVDMHTYASHAVCIGEVETLHRRRDADAALLYVDGAYAQAVRF